MNVMLSFLIIAALNAPSFYTVFIIGKPAIDSAEAAVTIRDAESFLKSLDNQINEVNAEGLGSRRIFPFSVADRYDISEEDDSIVYEKTVKPEIFEYQSSVISENMVVVSGSSVDCFEEEGTLVMENPFILAVFRKIAKTSPLGVILTNETVISLKEKAGGSMLNFSDSGIVIDNNATSSYGTGYTEVLKVGKDKPFCTVHMFVNSTPFIYDVFYTLYSSSDFIVADIRNIR